MPLLFCARDSVSRFSLILALPQHTGVCNPRSSATPSQNQAKHLHHPRLASRRSGLSIPATPRHHTTTMPSDMRTLPLPVPSVPSTVTATTSTPTTSSSTDIVPSTSRPPPPAKRQVKVRLDVRLHNHDFPSHFFAGIGRPRPPVMSFGGLNCTSYSIMH